MEDFPRKFRGPAETLDAVSLAHGTRVARRRENYTERRARVPLGRHFMQAAIDRRLTQQSQVRLQPCENGLRFRVAEAAVEFNHVRRSIRCDHDSRVEEARVGHPVSGESANRRLDDFTHDAVVDGGRYDWSGRVSAHATRVRSMIAVVTA